MASSSEKLTRFASAQTLVTSDFMNSIFGGLSGTTEGDSLSADDPRVIGHVHDGENLDGHAGKIDLVKHVEGQLRSSNIADSAITNSKITDGTITESKLAFSILDSSAAPRRFVYRPGGTAGGNVYNDFADLYSELSTVSGSKELVFDISSNGGSPISIPQGVYDFENTTWSTGGLLVEGNPVQVNLSDKVSIVNLYHIKNLLLRTFNTSGSCLFYNSTTPQTLVLEGSGILNTSSSNPPTISLVSPTNLEIVLVDGSIVSAASAPNINVQLTASVSFTLRNGVVSDNSLTGTGTFLIPTLDADSYIGITASEHPDFSGSFPASVNLSDRSFYVSYDNSDSGLTADNVKDAIDEIVAGGSFLVGATNNRVLRADGSSGIQDSGLSIDDFGNLGVTSSTQNLGALVSPFDNIYLKTSVTFEDSAALIANSGSVTITSTGTEEDITLNISDGTSGNVGNLVIQADGSDWLTFDANNAKIFPNTPGLVELGDITNYFGRLWLGSEARWVTNGSIASSGDFTISTEGAETDFILDLSQRASGNCGQFKIQDDSVDFLTISPQSATVSVASGMFFNASGDVTATGDDFALGALSGALRLTGSQDIEFRDSSGIIGAFDMSISGTPLVLAGSSSVSDVAQSGSKLYVSGDGAGTNPLTELICTRSLPTTTSAEILTLSFSNRSSPQSEQTYISFRDNAGEIGDISGDGVGGVAYSPFTGSHLGALPESASIENNNVKIDGFVLKKGMILVSTGKRPEGYPSPDVTYSSVPKDTRVMGVYASYKPPGHDRSFADNSRLLAVYHALGDGFVLVTNKNGDVKNGDLIETSSIPGFGQRQIDGVFKNCTVAKCTEQIDWEQVNDYIDGYKYSIVSCTYHCG